MNRFLLSLFLLSIALILRADPISDFTASTAVDADNSALLIIDLKSGKKILSHNADLPLIPASIMKSVTIATLLNKVGHNYEYATPVYLTAPVDDGIVEGNLLVEASGDPAINTVYDPKSEDFVAEIVAGLKALGVDTIRGKIVVDESKFPGPSINPTWQKGDLSYAYGTGTHGFNFQDNASGKKSVQNPIATFRSHLNTSLTAAGIAIQALNVEGSDHEFVPVCRHISPTIDEIMRSCMVRSDNQYAEAMLRLVGATYGDKGSTAEGAEQMLSFWRQKHANLKGVKIVDGSGLSRTNRLTVLFMADMLRIMAKNPYYVSFFPLSGLEGTLKHLLAKTPLEGYLALKTGSMKGVQCYAGYKLDDDYAPTHIVVVMLNNLPNRAEARRQLDTLLLKTFLPDYIPEATKAQ
ncbi:MAG: D-alanyl-D-alanine carboxypeptidase/D-alanyl-D-alanine-endopeptidase [Lepagella sp.]